MRAMARVLLGYFIDLALGLLDEFGCLRVLEGFVMVGWIARLSARSGG